MSRTNENVNEYEIENENENKNNENTYPLNGKQKLLPRSSASLSSSFVNLIQNTSTDRKLEISNRIITQRHSDTSIFPPSTIASLSNDKPKVLLPPLSSLNLHHLTASTYQNGQTPIIIDPAQQNCVNYFTQQQSNPTSFSIPISRSISDGNKSLNPYINEQYPFNSPSHGNINTISNSNQIFNKQFTSANNIYQGTTIPGNTIQQNNLKQEANSYLRPSMTKTPNIIRSFSPTAIINDTTSTDQVTIAKDGGTPSYHQYYDHSQAVINPDSSKLIGPSLPYNNHNTCHNNMHEKNTKAFPTPLIYKKVDLFSATPDSSSNTSLSSSESATVTINNGQQDEQQLESHNKEEANVTKEHLLFKEKGKRGRKKRAIHQCPICNRIVTRSYSLHAHMLVHTKDKPFKCEWEDCGKAFSIKSNLNRHMKIHSRKQKKLHAVVSKNDPGNIAVDNE